MKLLKIKVTEGKLIRDPKTAKRLVSGRCYTVPAINYWLKRLKCDDVMLFVADRKPIKKAPKEKPKEENKEIKEDKKPKHGGINGTD